MSMTDLNCVLAKMISYQVCVVLLKWVSGGDGYVAIDVRL